MKVCDRVIKRICAVLAHLDVLEKSGVYFVSSRELANAVGATAYTIRKDISLLGIAGYSRKGYEVRLLKQGIGRKFNLDKERKACIVGLGRLGTALLDYEQFKEDGFKIVAGFDCSINKIERIRTNIDIFPVSNLESVVAARGISLGIVAVPGEAAQNIVDRLIASGVKGILNFSPVKVSVPGEVVYLDMDFTNALRFIAARFTVND